MGKTITTEDLGCIPNSRGVDPEFPTPLEFFRHWHRARITLTLMLGVLVTSLVSNFFIQNTHPDVGNLFLNVAVYGLARAWVPFLIVFLDRKFHSISRKPTYLAFTAAVVVCTTVVALLEVSNLRSKEQPGRTAEWGSCSGRGTTGASSGSSSGWLGPH